MNIRLYILLASVFSALSLSAQTEDQLKSLFKAFSESHVTIEAVYEVESAKSEGSSSLPVVIMGETRISMQGDMYSMDGNGFSILCDGKAACITDTASKEVIYEPVAGSVRGENMMGPSLLFGNLGENFNVKSTAIESGQAVYELSADPSSGMEGCRICVDPESGALKSARFDMSDGHKVKVTVTVFNVSALRPDSEYELPSVSSFGADWVVTDLR